MSELSSQFGGLARELDKPVTQSYTTVLGPIDIQDYAHVAVYVESLAGSDNIVSVVLETSPEVSGRAWTEVDEVLAADLVAGVGAYHAFGPLALKYIRVRAKCGDNESAVAHFWLCASRFGR